MENQIATTTDNTIVQIVETALQLPGVKVNRSSFFNGSF